MAEDISEWMDGVAEKGWKWFVKFLAGNDTLLNKSHQAGPYVPKAIAFELFPSVYQPDSKNPRKQVPAYIVSGAPIAQRDVSMIWYNGESRNECRMTGWGGASSQVLDPDSTGSLAVFAFQYGTDADPIECHVWVCRTPEEEDAVMERVGPVEPEGGIIYRTSEGAPPRATGDRPCAISAAEMPKSWLVSFPEPAEIVAMAVQRLKTAKNQSPDLRLVRRRDCELELFVSVEELAEGPRVREGFKTVDLFVQYANSVTNRRKNRSGRSLELHTAIIFDEEHLQYDPNKESEDGKRPDFLFPSAAAYHSEKNPAKLRMLAAKTTCKDRWRQVIDEAKRIHPKHLLTLQPGISENQLKQMATAGIILVVPAKLHDNYPKAYRSSLLTLSAFIEETRALIGSGYGAAEH